MWGWKVTRCLHWSHGFRMTEKDANIVIFGEGKDAAITGFRGEAGGANEKDESLDSTEENDASTGVGPVGLEVKEDACITLTMNSQPCHESTCWKVPRACRNINARRTSSAEE